MSTTPILHHYPSSPFSEKIRALLGYKGMTWQSVIIPAVMPKPDVLALTGGYRKTPLLQLGCDVYCDTRLIARVIDALAPERTIYPQHSAGLAAMLAQWADQTLFYSVLSYAFSPKALVRTVSALKPEEVERFLQDRIAMGEGARFKPPPAHIALSHAPVYFAQLEAQLASQTYLCGTEPTIADFSVYHCLWFVAQGLPEALEPYPYVRAFMNKLERNGHGAQSTISSAEALEHCRTAQPRPLGTSLEQDVNGLTRGTRVMVRAADLGRDPVEGELIHIELDELVIRRQDERAGTVHVHFPRIGYELKAI